jgi:hypothetical protein
MENSTFSKPFAICGGGGLRFQTWRPGKRGIATCCGEKNCLTRCLRRGESRRCASMRRSTDVKPCGVHARALIITCPPSPSSHTCPHQRQRRSLRHSKPARRCRQHTRCFLHRTRHHHHLAAANLSSHAEYSRLGRLSWWRGRVPAAAR